MSSIVNWIITLIVVCIAIGLLVWFLISHCSNKKNVTVTRIGHPVSSGHRTNSSRSTPYLPFISPYPPKPPPLGFGDPVDMPQPDVGQTSSFNANDDLHTYPPNRGRAPYPAETSCYPPARRAPYQVTNANGDLDIHTSSRGRAPYPLHSENSRAPYPAETSSYPAHAAPYPVTNLIGDLDTHISSRGAAPYPLHSENNSAPYPTETSCYPPARTAPYPVTNSMPQPSTSRTSCSSKRNTHETSNSTRITPYPPAHRAPYPPSNECVIPRPSLSRTQHSFDCTTSSPISYSKRTAPFPPVRSASLSSELPPPTYEDAINKKF